MRKSKFLLGIIMSVLFVFSVVSLSACQRIGDPQTTPEPTSTPIITPTPTPVQEFKIDENFDNPQVDTPLWDLGDVKNMHQVANGKLTVTHTGVTDYPSKGKNLKASLTKYPYLAIKVDSLDGSSPMWAIKLLTAADATPSRSLQADTNQTGIFFYDLTKVDGLGTEVASFGLYIYILGGSGNSITIDYIKSVENIPETQNFDNGEGITATSGNVSFNDGIMTVASTEGNAVVEVPLYCNFDLANMIDLFITSVETGSNWSLTADGITLIQESVLGGAVAFDSSQLNLSGAKEIKFVFTVNGTVRFDQLKNNAYDRYNETFNYDEQTLLTLWKEKGSAYIEAYQNGDVKGLNLYKVYNVSGEAVVGTKTFTNVSVYPKFVINVESITANTTVTVKVNSQNLMVINTAGQKTANLIDKYFSDKTALNIELIISYSGTMTAETVVNAVITSISLDADATMSAGALPPKGVRIDREAFLSEEGNNADNWVGNAKVISRNGQLWIIQDSAAGYSKGEVFAKNVDLFANRYLNIKIDSLNSGMTYKVDVIYNPDMEGMTVKTAISENNNTGIFTVDLYQLFGLTETNKVATKVAYDIFVIGGVGKYAKVDYITNNDTVMETPVITAVPDADKTILAQEQLNISASLKFPVGNVNITVTDGDGTDVTESVLIEGVFATANLGTYTVVYSYEGAQTVTRTIEVITAEAPIIQTGNPTSTNVAIGKDVNIVANVNNPVAGTDLVYSVFLNSGTTDLSATVLTDITGGKKFNVNTTGVYKVVLSYVGATSVELTINVNTGWTPESAAQVITATNGTIKFRTTGYGWPKAKREYQIKIADAPFLKITIGATSNANWKLVFGYKGDFENDLQAETSKKGTYYYDLRNGGFNSTHQSQVMDVMFGLMVVGSNVDLYVEEFAFVTEAQLPPEIINVTPATNKTIFTGEELAVSASLKYGTEAVNIKITDGNGTDVTSSTLNSGIFSTSTAGIYTVEFSYLTAPAITKTITVVTPEVPVIQTGNLSTSDAEINSDVSILADVANPVAGTDLVYKVYLNSGTTDLSASVLTDITGGKKFNVNTTGVYKVVLSYGTASDVELIINVNSGWTPESAAQVITATDGIIKFHTTGYGWPKAKNEYQIKIADAPYLKITIGGTSNAEWKLAFGYKADFESELQASTTQKGTFYYDLRNGGFNETHQSQIMDVMFGLMVIGGDVDLYVEEFSFVTEIPQ